MSIDNSMDIESLNDEISDLKSELVKTYELIEKLESEIDRLREILNAVFFEIRKDI